MCGQVFGAQASKHQHDGCKVIPPPEIKKKEFKIVLIGGPKVGKSTLFHYQKYGVFNQKNYLSTIGAEFFQFSVVIENLQYKLNLWDCGEDRLRSLFPVFLRGADLAVLMFDLNDQQSFSDVYIWRDLMNKKIEQDKNDYIPIFLIGNKNDLEINVEKYEIQQFIESNPTNCEYEEMSLKQGECEENEVNFYCCDCYSKLCSGCCSTIHELKNRKNHQILELKKNEDNEEIITCKSHKNKKIIGFCEICEEMICFDCLGSHKKHEIKNIFEIKIKTEKEFNRLLKEVKVMKKEEWIKQLNSSTTLDSKIQILKNIKTELKRFFVDMNKVNDLQKRMISKCRIDFIQNEGTENEPIIVSHLKNKIKVNFYDEFSNEYILPLRQVKLSIKIEKVEEFEEGNAFREIEYEDIKFNEFNYLPNNEIEFILEKNGSYIIDVSFDKLNTQTFFKCVSPQIKFSEEDFNQGSNDVFKNGCFSFLKKNVEITCSSIKYGKVENFIMNENQQVENEFYTNDTEGSWIQFSFKHSGFQLNPKLYVIKHGYHFGDFILRNWKLEGSKNGIDWKLIKEHKNDQNLKPLGHSNAFWKLEQEEDDFYGFLKITQIDKNSYGTNHLFLGSIEFYGFLKK